MVVSAALGVKTLKEFVALAKSKPGALNYGTTGVGAANHLVTELFDSRAGIKMTHIPYRGTALAVTDLLAGQVQVVFADPISALQYVNSGALIALAVTSKDRSPVAPDGADDCRRAAIPASMPSRWHGILAPAKTPPAIVARLNAEIVKALKDPETRTLLEKPGDAGRRQFAGGIRPLHQAGHRDLEGSGGPGQDRSEVTRPSYQGPVARSW